jgi:hypothetical protein
VFAGGEQTQGKVLGLGGWRRPGRILVQA